MTMLTPCGEVKRLLIGYLRHRSSMPCTRNKVLRVERVSEFALGK